MPPRCAMAIAMSASVTVSIAEDRIGICSGVSRVRKVRVSAWLGSTLDSSGCSRTSSNVSPSGMSGASVSWAISAHDRQRPIRQASLPSRPLQHALRRLDVHALDHLIVEPLGASAERLDERFGALDLSRAWRERLVARSDLVGVDQALAVEPKPAPALGLRKEAVGIIEPVEHAVERHDAGCAGGEDNHLQRSRDR